MDEKTGIQFRWTIKLWSSLVTFRASVFVVSLVCSDLLLRQGVDVQGGQPGTHCVIPAGLLMQWPSCLSLLMTCAPTPANIRGYKAQAEKHSLQKAISKAGFFWGVHKTPHIFSKTFPRWLMRIWTMLGPVWVLRAMWVRALSVTALSQKLFPKLCHQAESDKSPRLKGALPTLLK